MIERPAKSARITIHSARPGVVIGKKGEDIEILKRDLQTLMGVPVHVNIEEIRRPELMHKSLLMVLPSSLKTCSIPSRYETCNAKCNAFWC